MKHFGVNALVALVAMILLSGPAAAQEVSRERIVTGLNKLTAAAPVIDVELLRQEALNSNGAEMSGLPNWSKIEKLPQMVVEIDFENNSVAIEPKSYRTLGMIADAMHHPNLWAYKFLIIGHSSSTGGEKRNLELSEQRAAAIQEALATTFAIDPGRLYSIGVGEAFPIPGSDSRSAANRRVQLINLGIFRK
jgi:outer membrane protein OmpA-like peptidoglycan-associated protein